MPRIQRNLAEDRPVQATPSPEDLGAAEGRALERVGQAMGEANQVLGSIYDGYQQQKATRLGIEAEDRLRRFTEDLSQDPDFEAREQKFSARAAELRAELGRDLTPRRRADFDRLLSQAQNRYGVAVRADARKSAIEAAEFETNEVLRQSEIRITLSDDPFDQANAHKEGRKAIEDFGQRFGLRPDQIEQQVQAFDRRAGNALFAQQLRVDPVEAYRQLEDESGRLRIGRDALEIEQMKTKAIEEVERRVLRDDQMEAAEWRKLDRRRKEASRSALTAIASASRTEDGASLEMIYGFEDALGPEKFMAMVEWQKNTGGVVKRTDVNPEAFADLLRRARSGDYIDDDVLIAETVGDLDVGARNAILSTSEDTRFAPAENMLRRAVGEFTGGPVRQRVAQAEMEFTLWKADHPQATLSEAMAKAAEISDRVQIYDLDSVSMAKLPPPFAVFEEDGRTIRREESEERIVLEIPDPGERARALKQLDAFASAQEAEAKRRALREAEEASR